MALPSSQDPVITGFPGLGAKNLGDEMLPEVGRGVIPHETNLKLLIL